MNMQLPRLHPEVEGEERQRHLPLRQPDVEQRPREAEPVQQPEGEGHNPRKPPVSPGLGRPGRTSSAARNMIDSATTASTGGAGTTIHPSAAAARLSECATVKAVTAPTSRRRSRTSRISAKTNIRWSIPRRIWSTPSPK